MRRFARSPCTTHKTTSINPCQTEPKCTAEFRRSVSIEFTLEQKMIRSPDQHAQDVFNDGDERLEQLVRSIAHTGNLRTLSVPLPLTETSVTVTYPTDTDLLLDHVSGDAEQNLPYWAEIWPSGIALATAIDQKPGRVRNLNILELGCGMGITASVAVQRGAHLTVTDYAAEALTLTRLTTRRHTGREPERVHQLNWRAGKVTEVLENAPFDVVLAADVLYERRDIEPLLRAVETLVKPSGALWLAEPGRKPATIFLNLLQQRGWMQETAHWDGPWPDPKDADVIVHSHWLMRNPLSGLDNPTLPLLQER